MPRCRMEISEAELRYLYLEQRLSSRQVGELKGISCHKLATVCHSVASILWHYSTMDKLTEDTTTVWCIGEPFLRA